LLIYRNPLNGQNDKAETKQQEQSSIFSLGPPVLVGEQPSPRTEVVKKVPSRRKGKRPPMRKTTPGRFTRNPLVIKEELPMAHPPPPPPPPPSSPQGIGEGEIAIDFDNDTSVDQMVNKLVENHMKKRNFK